MSPTHQRIGVVWAPEARADLRAIDRETAIGILHCLDRYLKNRGGDVKQLKPPTDYRLRCGDYRLFFDFAVYETRSGRTRINTMEHPDYYLSSPPRSLPVSIRLAATKLVRLFFYGFQDMGIPTAEDPNA